jgi:hypothetical protein
MWNSRKECMLHTDILAGIQEGKMWGNTIEPTSSIYKKELIVLLANELLKNAYIYVGVDKFSQNLAFIPKL